jgi:hypothetical protein
MNTNRCPASTYHHKRGYLQCEGLEGHHSAHFCDDYWWSNQRGLPKQPHQHPTNALGCVALGWIAAAATLAGAITWLVLHHR